MRPRLRLAALVALACSGLLLAVVAGASPPKAGAGYRGETSQGREVRFRVTPQGDLIRSFAISRTFTCRRGRQRSSLSGRFRQVTTPIELRGAGGFHGEVKVRGIGASRVRHGKVCVRGDFQRRGRIVRGRYREVLRLRDGSLCRTGLLRFIARAG